MKLLIITNTFGNYHRQNVAVDSWRHLKSIYPDNVDILNLQFEDEKDTFVNPYPDIKTLFCLTNTLDIVEGATKKLPFMSEMFSQGLSQMADYDGFIWTNSDVIITRVLIEKIINTKPKALACSRLDIEDIDSFQRILEQKVKPVRWEIAGIDTCYFRKDWAETHAHLFTSNQYLMGKFLFDCHWGAIIRVYGDAQQKVENSYPVSCFHIHHGIAAVTADCAERTWNLKVAQSNPMNIMLINVWAFYFSQILGRRTPYGSFLNERDDEPAIESTYFSYMNINRNLT